MSSFFCTLIGDQYRLHYSVGALKYFSFPEGRRLQVVHEFSHIFGQKCGSSHHQHSFSIKQIRKKSGSTCGFLGLS